MNDDDTPRPVSGEIMAGPGANSPARRAVPEIADAVFETIAPARDATPVRFPDAQPATGMEYLKAGVAAVEARSRHGGPLFWTCGLALVALAFWVSGGHALVRQQAAAIPSAETAREALRIGTVTSRVERHGSRDVLFVDGSAENRGSDTRILPPFEIVVTATDGGITNYFLGTNDASLAPGGRYSFSSRLEAPRNGVKSVSVTFRETQR